MDEATNDRVQQLLRNARNQLEEKRRKGAMIKENLVDNYDVPKPIRDVFRDGQGLTTNFSVKVFVPISKGMPAGVEYPDFFQPFAIPVDDFKRYDLEKSLKIVFGENNFEGYRKIYDHAVTVGDTTHAQIKAVDVDDLDRDYVQVQEFGDEEIEVYDPGRPTRKVKSFRQKWSDMFDEEGVVCSSDFPYPLRDQLKDALLDDETDCIVLYTGFLRNTGLKKFVMTYFMETYRSIMDGLTMREEQGMDRKFVLSFLEAQEAIIDQKKYQTLSEQDKQFNSFMHTYANQMRHHNSDLWADAKPDDCHPMVLSRSQHTIVTRVNPENWADLFKNRSNDLKETARAAFMNEDYRENVPQGSKYGPGFVFFSEGEIKSWKKSKHAQSNPGVQTYGYRHLAPRQCVHREPPFSNTGPVFFTETLGFSEAGRTILFDDYLKAFREDWGPAEAKPIAIKDGQLEQERKEQEQEEQDKREMREENVKTQLRLMVEQGGIPTTWREYLREIKDDMQLDVTMKTLENWTKDLRDELKQNAVADTEIADEEVEALGKEVMRDEMFVFGCLSQKKKRTWTRKYLQDEHGFDEQEAEAVAEDVVEEAVMRLTADGIIDRNHYPLLEGETQEEKKQRFREIMGLNVADEDRDDHGEPESGSTGESADNTPGVSDEDSGERPEPPGQAWTCTCGAENAPDRAVCRRCAASYEDVDSDD